MENSNTSAEAVEAVPPDATATTATVSSPTGGGGGGGSSIKETKVVGVTAQVHFYSTKSSGWKDQGLARVCIFHNPGKGTFRVVAREGKNPKNVLINSYIFAGMVHREDGGNFIQWADRTHLYGLKFPVKLDCTKFSEELGKAVNSLNERKLKAGGITRTVSTPSRPGGTFSARTSQASPAVASKTTVEKGEGEEEKEEKEKTDKDKEGEQNKESEENTMEKKKGNQESKDGKGKKEVSKGRKEKKKERPNKHAKGAKGKHDRKKKEENKVAESTEDKDKETEKLDDAEQEKSEEKEVQNGTLGHKDADKVSENELKKEDEKNDASATAQQDLDDEKIKEDESGQREGDAEKEKSKEDEDDECDNEYDETEDDEGGQMLASPTASLLSRVVAERQMEEEEMARNLEEDQDERVQEEEKVVEKEDNEKSENESESENENENENEKEKENENEKENEKEEMERNDVEEKEGQEEKKKKENDKKHDREEDEEEVFKKSATDDSVTREDRTATDASEPPLSARCGSSSVPSVSAPSTPMTPKTEGGRERKKRRKDEKKSREKKTRKKESRLFGYFSDKEKDRNRDYANEYASDSAATHSGQMSPRKKKSSGFVRFGRKSRRPSEAGEGVESECDVVSDNEYASPRMKGRSSRRTVVAVTRDYMQAVDVALRSGGHAPLTCNEATIIQKNGIIAEMSGEAAGVKHGVDLVASPSAKLEMSATNEAFEAMKMMLSIEREKRAELETEIKRLEAATVGLQHQMIGLQQEVDKMGSSSSGVEDDSVTAQLRAALSLQCKAIDALQQENKALREGKTVPVTSVPLVRNRDHLMKQTSAEIPQTVISGKDAVLAELTEQLFRPQRRYGRVEVGALQLTDNAVVAAGKDGVLRRRKDGPQKDSSGQYFQ